MTHPELSPAQAEAIEAEFLFQFETGAPAATRDELGINTTRIGGGVVLSMRDDPTGFWSKALGFGFDQPVTADLIAEVIEFFRANRDPRATIQIAPSALPANWDEIAAKHDLRPTGRTRKHVGRIEALQLGRSDLRIGEVAPDQAEEWARVSLVCFGMPQGPLTRLMAAAATNPVFQPFAAWDGDQMVAVGDLFVQGEVASLHGGATLPEYRGRGAQSALITARIAAAAAAGCRWVVAETAESGQSANNMSRIGLTSLHVRQSWTWLADPAD